MEMHCPFTDEKCQVLKYPESAPNTNTQRNTDACRDPQPALIYLLSIFDAVCCLAKDPLSKDLWAAGTVVSQAIEVQQTRNRFLSPIRLVSSTVHFLLAVPSARGVTGQAVPGCHCAALCQKQEKPQSQPSAAGTGTPTHDKEGHDHSCCGRSSRNIPLLLQFFFQLAL